MCLCASFSYTLFSINCPTLSFCNLRLAFFTQQNFVENFPHWYIETFFFLHCSKYFTVWICHILFNWSPIDGYLERFYFFTMTNSLHVHLCTPCMLGQMFLGVDNRDVDLLGHRVCTCHNLTDIANCSSQDWTNLFPICSIHEILLSPTSFSTFDLVKLKIFLPIVFSYCCANLHLYGSFLKVPGCWCGERTQELELGGLNTKPTLSTSVVWPWAYKLPLWSRACSYTRSLCNLYFSCCLRILVIIFLLGSLFLCFWDLSFLGPQGTPSSLSARCQDSEMHG